MSTNLTAVLQEVLQNTTNLKVLLLVNVGATLLAMVLPMAARALIFGVRVAWLRLRYEVPLRDRAAYES